MTALTTYLASPECRDEVKAVAEHVARLHGDSVTTQTRPLYAAALNALCEQLALATAAGQFGAAEWSRLQARISELELAEGYATRRAEDAEARIRELEAEVARLKGMLRHAVCDDFCHGGRNWCSDPYSEGECPRLRDDLADLRARAEQEAKP